MGIVYTKDLLPGMVAASDVYNISNQLIIPVNTTLTELLIDQLKANSIAEINVAGPITSIPSGNESYSEKVTHSESFRQFKEKFTDSSANLENAMNDILNDKPINTNELVEQTVQMVPERATSIEIFDMIHNMRSYDDSTYAHCMNVALICRVMAGWLKLSDEDTEILTLCGLFHDIGKTEIPDEIIQKPGKLTDEEFEIMKSHSQKGYDILKNKDIDERIKLTALQHHERCDGSGYPNNLPASEINLFAKLVAIADVYDAMTSARVYRKGLCPFKVISIFEEEGLQKYDPKYILTFLERIGSSYINNHVRLSDGRVGEVVMLNQNKLSRPMIKIGEEYINLAKTTDIEIAEIV